jgi:hypothetical protein
VTMLRRILAAALLAVALVAGQAAPPAHATAGSWVLMNDARTLILQGSIKTGDAFKVQLYTSSVAATNTTCSGISGEVSSTNTGYTTGGQTVTLSLSGTTSVIVYFSSQPQWTAGSANLAAVAIGLCDTTSGNELAAANLDSGGATITTTSGQTLTVSDVSGNPILTFS